jgi:arylsulfatase A-like enzyme
MTGRYPIRTGGQHGVARAIGATWIPEDETLLPEALSALGYTVVASGKWHLGNGHFKYGPTGCGFREFFGMYAYRRS